MKDKEYLVDVIMLVYNHENYLKQAIEGVVLQKTNFPFRLLIGEDCSKDNSREIVKKYAAQYPDIIQPLLHEKNLGTTGNSMYIYQLLEAKYIALCEGDDFWTDDTKLQRQVDFMEANPEFSMCFTDVDILNETGTEQPYPYDVVPRDTLTIDDFILTRKVFAPTVTLLFRNILPKMYPDFYLNGLSGDIAMHFLLTDKGPAKYLKGKTAVYRQNMGGVTKSKEHLKNADKKLFEMYEEANKYFEFKYDKTFRQKLSDMSKERLIYGSKNLKGGERLGHIMRSYKKYLKYQRKFNPKEFFYYFTILFFPSVLKLIGKRTNK